MIEKTLQNLGVRTIPFGKMPDYVLQNGTGVTPLTARPIVLHEDVLAEILSNLQPIDFRAKAGLDENEKITQKHFCVITVQEVVETARVLNCGLCRHLDFVYAYNGQFWRQIEKEELCQFLGEAAERLGVEPITARYYQFREGLLKQFFATAYLPRPQRKEGVTLINLENGTFEITLHGQSLREHRREDFLTYMLPFRYDQNFACPKWLDFLDRVLPEKARQDICAEFVGYTFTDLKLEKVFLPYGSGANGKSVFFDVITALLGEENISHYSLQSLGAEYNRAKLANKLLNYASEVSTRLEAEILKKLASGEPVEARLPYGQPFILSKYAKLAFNCNELPRDVEHTEAYFRRFLIIPFDVTIPENERNPNLAREIIAKELPGIFNWVLEGLRRLLQQGNFTECRAVRDILAAYRKESDSVAMFVEDEKWESDPQARTTLRNLYSDYKTYCAENGYKALGRNRFGSRLEAIGISRMDTNQPVFLIARNAEWK